MIYKLSDGTRVRVTHDDEVTQFETYQFTPEKRVISVERLTGDEAERRLSELTILDGFRFAREFGGGPLERLAHTGRPSRTPLRAAAVTAGVTTALALAAALAQPHSAGEDMAPAPYFSRTSEGIEPYYPTPKPRTSTHTSRHGERKALTAEHIATPSTTPTKRHPIATPPADIRISFYRDCTGHAQECIDAGALTMYARNILAGHNYMGYQWLSRVPVGQEVRVISGPLAGTYEVYGHLRIGRQGGSIPAFPGSPALVLQTCVGNGTGFSLLRRV
jgi:hypothetical protein